MFYDEALLDDPKASAKLFEEFYRNFQKHSKNSGLRESVRKKSLIKTLFFAKEYLSAEEIGRVRLTSRCFTQSNLVALEKILSTFSCSLRLNA